MLKLSLLGMLALCLLTACGKSDNQASLTQQTAEKQAKNSIKIGVSWATGFNDYVQGVQLAVDEINASGGLLDNRPLEIVLDNQENDPNLSGSDLARIIAGRLIEQNVIAVIGHRFSSLAVPASNLYERYKVVFIPPTATGLALTRFKFKYVFRMFPSNEEIGKQLAEYAWNNGYHKIAILSDRRDYPREFAGEFERAAIEKGIKITYRQSFFANKATESELREIVVKLKRFKDFDAILVVTGESVAARLYKTLQLFSVQQPILGGDSLDADEFWKVIREAEGELATEHKTVVPTVYNPNTAISRKFIRQFKAAYNREPDRFGALGYDSVKLIAHAITAIKSAKPADIADSLRYIMVTCQGTTGRHDYFDSGDLINKRLFLKSVKGKGNDFNYKPPFAIGNYRALESYFAARVAQCYNTDIDEDGVFNSLDKCPNNTALEIAKTVYKSGDKIGCPLDSDNDDVPDFRDLCPQDSPEELARGVNHEGCPRDTDNDGVPDYQDECLNTTPEEVQAGLNRNGCPLTIRRPADQQRRDTFTPRLSQ